MKSKKALAIVLAIAMLFGVVSVASAASGLASNGFADSQDSKQADAIAFLKAFGVLKGDAGTNNVRPNDPLTREEFVVMVTRATGTETLAQGLAGYRPNFTDAAQISDWAVGAVNLATGQGWIKGYEDGTFRPKGNLTMAEAITVLVRATGHELNVSNVAVWPVGHVMVANDVGITRGVTVNFNAPITREDMARITYNSLFVDTARKDGDKIVSGKPLVTALGTVVEGLVTDVSAGDSEIDIDLWDDNTNNWAGNPDTHDLAESVTVIGANSLVGLRGLTVRAIKNIEGDIYIIEVTRGTASAAVYDKPGGKANARTMVLSDGKSIKVDTNTKFYFNEDTTAVQAADDDELLDILDGTNNPSLGKGDEIVATVGANGVATEVQVLKLDVRNLIVTDVTKATDDDPAVITAKRYNQTGDADFTVAGPVLINGETATGDDIKVGDVIDVATDELDGFTDTIALKIRVTRNVVTGTVEANKWALNSAGAYVVTTTLKFEDGSTKDYTWLPTVAAAGNGGAAKNSIAVFVLNADGRVLINDAAAATAQYVKIVSIYNDGTHDYVEVDAGGTTKVYRYTPGTDPGKIDFDQNDLGVVGDLEVDANGATAFTPAAGYADATVQSVSGDYVVLKMAADGSLRAVHNAAVYAFVNGDKAGDYVGAEGLKAGDTVRVDNAFKVILVK